MGYFSSVSADREALLSVTIRTLLKSSTPELVWDDLSELIISLLLTQQPAYDMLPALSKLEALPIRAAFLMSGYRVRESSQGRFSSG